VLSGFLFSFLSGIVQAANTPFDPKDYKDLGIYFVGEDCNLTGAKTTSDTGGGANSPVFILGDSIMWGGFYSGGGFDKAFDAKDFETIVDAQGARVIKEYPGKASASSPLNKKATTGLQAVDEDKAEIKKAETIIIELGTNQEGDGSASVFKDNMTELVKKIKGVNDQAKIYAVNFFSTGMKNRQAHNKALDEIAGKENLTVIDTTKQSFPLDSENIHPLPDDLWQSVYLVQ
jgi:lysophospholipase L1-like esterase